MTLPNIFSKKIHLFLIFFWNAFICKGYRAKKNLKKSSFFWFGRRKGRDWGGVLDKKRMKD